MRIHGTEVGKWFSKNYDQTLHFHLVVDPVSKYDPVGVEDRCQTCIGEEVSSQNLYDDVSLS